jgi:hypothetical protein
MRSAIEINRKNLAIAGVSLIIYSLALVTIWELFYGVEAKGRINPDGSVSTWSRRSLQASETLNP